MPMRSLTLILLLAATPVAAQDSDTAARAEAATAEIRSAKDYLRDMRTAVDLAKKGDYGKIKQKERERLDASYARLKQLLDDVESPLELPLDQRIEVFNAQEVIVSIVERHPKDTMICRRKQSTGTRIPATECLTIAQREARARASREATERLAKPNPCVTGSNC